MVFQPKASSWLINNLDGCWHDAHNQSEDNSQKKPERKSFMMNQAIPHLGAWSSLMNDASSNCRRRPRMGTVFIDEWMAGTWMSQCIGRTKKALGYKQGHPMTMEHQGEGDLYFKSGKDTCISSNLQKKKKNTPFAHIFQLSQENPKEMKRSTLQPGSLEFSTLAVRKHRVFKPHDQELAGSTEFSSPFFCHPFRTSPGKSYFSHRTSSYFFHLGRSPITMRLHFIFFPRG